VSQFILALKTGINGLNGLINCGFIICKMVPWFFRELPWKSCNHIIFCI